MNAISAQDLAAIERCRTLGQPADRLMLSNWSAQGQSLESLVFHRCDRRGARFAYAALAHASFIGCDLRGADFPDARLERVEGAKTFVALDQPERLAELITAFMRETAPAPA